jgi:hypothetical protein
MKTVLSYGGGVQTRAIVELILRGEYKRPDLICFGDTQGEPDAVYGAVQDDEVACTNAGIPFVIASKGELAAWRANGSIHTPLYTSDGGQLFRTCTDRFKIDAVEAECRARGWGYKKENVEMWLGFSMDEVHRVGSGAGLPSWVSRAFPLLDLGLRRSDCERILRESGKPIVKSACVYCPWKSRFAWSEMRTNDPVSWSKAVVYDESIRNSRPGLLAYVHQDRHPLPEVPLLQPGLFDIADDRCETGLCFN